MIFDEVCIHCRAGFHEECSETFGGELPPERACCCDGLYDRHQHLIAIQRTELDSESAAPKRKAAAAAATVDTPPAPPKGDSGYIHPDAWVGDKDLGDFADPVSTGRKRVARMYPITGGQVCEWAGKKDNGGGPLPVMGCINNPATDLHHGPDKHTLNNAKKTRGVGESENVHVICSECHNAWHAANDPHYPPYDRVAQQREPWLPRLDIEWGPQESSPADYDDLVVEDRRRHEQAKKRGREHRGRNAEARADVDTGFTEDDD